MNNKLSKYLLSGSVICICKIIGKQAFDITLLGMEFSTESASSLIVRDQRGHGMVKSINFNTSYNFLDKFIYLRYDKRAKHNNFSIKLIK